MSTKTNHPQAGASPADRHEYQARDDRRAQLSKHGPLARDRQVGGSHYRDMNVQPGEFAEKNSLSYFEGCVVKRVCRHSRGGKGIEDIQKAIHELQLIALNQYGVEL